MELTQKDLSALVGYTYRRLLDINRALPDERKLFVKGPGGKFLLDMFVQHWTEYQVEKAQGSGADIDALKATHEEVKIERSRVELSRLRGELVDAREARSAWVNVAARVRQRMLEIPARIAPGLVGADDEEDIAAAIDSEIRDALSELADMPDQAGETLDADGDDEEDERD